MADGEFSKALDHIARILKKNPDDQEAKQLEYTCREMIHIQNACEEDPERKNDISVDEYVTVHARRLVKKLCRLAFTVLTRLPEGWQKKLNTQRLLEMEKRYTVETDSQKDWMWELLFWDTRRRITVFSFLIAALLLGITMFLVLFFHGCEQTDPEFKNDFSALVQAAHDGETQAQYLLGESFYYGKNVNRDVEKALFWLAQAARSGHFQASELLQKILVEQDIRVQEGKYIWGAKDERSSGLLK